MDKKGSKEFTASLGIKVSLFESVSDGPLISESFIKRFLKRSQRRHKKRRRKKIKLIEERAGSDLIHLSRLLRDPSDETTI